ncbi:Acyl-CoA synthetase (AMP-forming)/AMP-acid ligase II [Oribacterium sp. KHPX15]|uniref:non-ribosomal peptide synthetase n=1 Tax=Oribacterium sp. KHPX15 TaxID=1855342 RepID=UPI00089641FD|nr:non-ribosomal peptide synthetase [Oribacterium sp. KHPX15]SEA90066.1 Acyl-CoA synthetase (AMP-forming)/AMP-acid ligase II [Oribacterium sp. KHPX15]
MNYFLKRVSDITSRYPDRIAAIDETRTMTYEMLDQESGRVYNALKSEGIGPGDTVLIIMKRNISFFPCLLGVLKAGACFVPLEKGYPEQRVEKIKQDSGCARVIDDEVYEEIQNSFSPLQGQADADPHDMAYLIYTSGSTGNPKGVIHEYGNLSQMAECFPEQEDYPPFKIAFIPPFYFVASVILLGEYLVKGRTIYLISKDLVRNLPALLDFIKGNGIQGTFLSPSYMRLCNVADTCLSQIKVGSEPANGIWSPNTDITILNSYSMSEAGFTVLEQPLVQPYDPAPVGKPILDIDLHLVDEDGNRVEGPGTGELCFKNEYVRGYLNLPEKTKEVFRDGYYYTGDLARRDEEGRFYILGRNDDMIKINGNRVEPAEIEKVIKDNTGLSQVVAKGFSNGGRTFVVAYYINSEAKDKGLLKDGKFTFNTSDLLKVLPEYMIPSFFVGMDAFPLNPNGKLSRKYLLPPETSDMPQREYIAPETDTEKLICDLFSQVLGIKEVGVTDDFFLLGGDSLTAITFVEKCSKIGIQMDYRALSECRVPKELSLNWHQKEDAGKMKKLDDEAREKVWPQLEGQILHVDMQKVGPASPFLNVPSLWKLKKDVDLNRLKKAIEKVISHHPVLNLKLYEENGGYYQKYVKEYEEPVKILDITEKELEDVRKIRINKLTDTDKLYCFYIYRTTDGNYLYYNIHHSNCDGTSLQIIRDQIYRCYMDEAYEIPPDYYFEMVRRLTLKKQDKEACQSALKKYEDIMGDSSSWQGRKIFPKPDTDGPPEKSELIKVTDFATLGPGINDAFFITATLRAMGKYNGTGEGMLWVTSSERDDEIRKNTAGFIARFLPLYLGKEKNTQDIINRQMECLKAYPELEDTLFPISDFFDMLHFNHLGSLLEQGEIENLTEKSEDLRIFDITPGLLSLVITDHPDDNKVDMLLYYSTNHYKKESMERFVKLILEEVKKWKRE